MRNILIMVQRQLCTLEHLMNSGFGRPFPRHGLQLLFWFATQCVTCEVMNLVVIMRLVADCEPEAGFYGFHLFCNIERLLPVLNGPRRQVVYYEVGNLNTGTYPAAANLPSYVRENYGLRGNRDNNNIDRIIISCQVRTWVVERVYVTEHDGENVGQFNPDRTYEISYELIQALQSPQLDLNNFLTQVGYFEVIPMLPVNNREEMHYQEQARAVQGDYFKFFSEVFSRLLHLNIEPFSYEKQAHYNVNITTYNGQLAANYSEVQHNYRRSRVGWRLMRQSYWPSGLEQLHEGFDGNSKKRGGGGYFSFIKFLLSVGVLCLAAKCFSCLRCWQKVDLNENNLKMIPWRTPSYQHSHVMLDYVF